MTDVPPERPGELSEVAPKRGARVAFFGGSFDPPHLGHLAVARAARDALHLDRVLFAPVGAQPLKPHGSTASFADRLAMTELAIAGEAGFEVSVADAPDSSGKPNYTLATLRSLRTGVPAGGSLFCLMGADSLASLRRWRGAADIPFEAALIVASRPGQELDDLSRFLPQGLRLEPSPSPVILGEGRKAAAAEGSAVSGSIPQNPPIELRPYLLSNPAGQTAPFYLLPGLDVEISASEIRKQIRCFSQDPSATNSLLPPAVAAYIRTHALYR